jgi:murein DD-endopeptidase MepM/ murein hydrolase activator NlpD
MKRLEVLARRLLIPITIMAVPHTKSGSLKLKVPVGLVVVVGIFTVIGVVYVAHLAVNSAYYYEMRRRLAAQSVEMRSSLASLRSTEDEFRHMLGLDGKKDVVLLSGTGDTDAIDMETLAAQVRRAIESISEIKKYLDEKHNRFLATPAGLPVDGNINSYFGPRKHPRSGEMTFHRGIDISAPEGTPVRATADGIISFSGFTPGGGNVVVVEHGFGFSTAYAHGTRNTVKAGQRVRRGDMIMISGTTGTSTGPHVHYEVWKQGRQIDPLSIRKEG